MVPAARRRPDWLRAAAAAWRAADAPSDLEAAELSAATPRLLQAGLAPLVWWRLRDRLEVAAALGPLNDARRATAIQHALGEARLLRAFRLLRSVGVEPILGKGWAAARLYPDPALRPYGDVDLYVEPRQERTAREALAAPAAEDCVVDLHAGVPDLLEPWDGLAGRSIQVAVRQTEVRMFSAEDHLRLLARHALRHGLRRPLWLCDVAVAVERAGAGLDWGRTLGPPRAVRESVLAACLLARDLLDARMDSAPPVLRQGTVPAWLRRAALREWSSGGLLPQGARAPLSHAMRRPSTLPRALRLRWPNPIEATAELGAPMDALPRLPFQLACLARRVVRFALGGHPPLGA